MLDGRLTEPLFGGKMKIATWNLMVTEYWSKLKSQPFIEEQIARQRQALDFLKNNLNADIALLQEVLLKSIDETELNVNIFWTETHTSKNAGSEWGTAIFVNKKYCNFTKDITLEVFPNENNKYNSEYTGKVKVVQVNFNNNQILFCSLHIDTDEKGPGQLKTFFTEEFVSKKNLVIGGDLNCDKYYIHGNPDDKVFFNETIKNSNLIECEPLYKQTFFRGNLNDDKDVEAIQDDHIFISKELYQFVETQHMDDVKQYKGKNFNYGKIKTLSDHSILYISLDVKE